MLRVVSLLLLFQPIECFGFGNGSGANASSDRVAANSQFAASSKQVAFPIRLPNGSVAIYLADHDQRNARKMVSEGSHLLWPYLSTDGLRIIAVRQMFNEKSYELISCEIYNFNCRVLVKTGLQISSPIELSEGVVLYSASPVSTRVGARNAYDRSDFWMVAGTSEPRPLTDLQFYELGSISVSPDHIYFSAMGPRRDKPILPPFQPLAPERSDIFRLPFSSAELSIKIPDQTLSPLYPAGGISTQASVSADGSLIAFLQSKSGMGTYRFDLILADRITGQTRSVASSGLGFSRPIVIGTKAFSKEVFEKRYEVISIALLDLNPKVEFQVTDSEIEKTEARTITIK